MYHSTAISTAISTKHPQPAIIQVERLRGSPSTTGCGMGIGGATGCTGVGTGAAGVGLGVDLTGGGLGFEAIGIGSRTVGG